MQDALPAPRRQSDILDPARAAAFEIALGQDPTITHGSRLPPFFHQLYFWDPQPPENLGRDSHPKTGIGLIPDLGLPRRMWAGGQLEFHADLLAGIPAEMETHVVSTTRKEGRTGPLGFVRLRQDITQQGRLCTTEWRDLVYREDPAPDAPKPVPPTARTDAAHTETVHFDSTLLFRYSALTFNGHKIHYDIDYCREVEGYPGLVVHGPLLAQQLMLLAERMAGPLSRFSFRATAPLMHHESATLCWGGDGSLWVRGPDGRQCMIADTK
jgi:3-methylfumaryl-CoA hydratase